MTVSLIILAALVAAGLPLYLLHRRDLSRNNGSDESSAEENQTEDGCCGMHITCEKDSLLASVSPDVVYYDDEELDRFAGRSADSYSDPEIEEFRDVLLTLLPDDIAGWGRSIQLRGITLPDAVKDELLLIVSEARKTRNIL